MLDAEISRLVLPAVPDELLSDPVAVWSEPLTIDTYLPEDADAFPEYLDSRVYQGSSGRVFPLPFIERVASEKVPHTWQAVHVENEWIRVVILPELGGRIHIGYDKVADYDFFYRNNVIKPALVGLAGPWISGGVEFNWPQHHRPATFLPTDVEIEKHDDGSVTVWCSDHDPFARMKGMHGIHVSPDSSRIEARVRLQNRTETTQSFLWWANVAARVGDDYQSFFPGDVGFVADHARRATTAFPRADRPYYGVDYPARRDAAHPDADRLDWYRNIPVPTSYMVTSTDHEFFGGYDHGRDAGFVHWAPRELSPGKKQWTWGNAPFGHAWDANLTDDDGPYVELMAGVFTDNQPDFAWLAPGETKVFRQLWYPIRGTGLVTAASQYGAARVEQDGDGVLIVIAPAIRADGARLTVRGAGGAELVDRVLDLDPARTVELRVDVAEVELELRHEGRLLLRATSREPLPHPEPATAEEPPAAADVETADELHAIATYLLQYRHATRNPQPYWEEALRRDPGDVRSRTALGALEYGRARFDEARRHLEVAVARSTRWTPTPRDAEPLYLLGIVESRRGDLHRAGELLARAAWDAAWRDASLFALARVRAAQGQRHLAITTLRDLLPLRPDHLQSRDLLAALLQAEGDQVAAASIVAAVLSVDPLDQWARHLAGLPVSDDAPTVLDIALEYASAGLVDCALEVLDLAEEASTAPGQVQVTPIVAYHRAAFLDAVGRPDEAAVERARARTLDLRHAQALRLDDVRALELALAADPEDPSAALLLGNWYYDRHRGSDAIVAWRIAARASRPDIAVIALRNLGLAAYNLEHDREAARSAYEAARALAPDDAKLLYEYDQLRARLGDAPSARLELLVGLPQIVGRRDDLMVSFVELLVQVGRIAEARDIMSTRRFQPWEGGEGRVLSAWDAVNLAEARAALERADVEVAIAAIERSMRPPATLGEGRHELANAAELWLVLGDSLDIGGDSDGARAAWTHAADDGGDFVRMSVTSYSTRTIWTLVALRRLGRLDEADELEAGLRAWLEAFAAREPQVDFFATSLPSMLLFTPDLRAERDADVAEIRRQLSRLDETAPLREDLQRTEAG